MKHFLRTAVYLFCILTLSVQQEIQSSNVERQVPPLLNPGVSTAYRYKPYIFAGHPRLDIDVALPGGILGDGVSRPQGNFEGFGTIGETNPGYRPIVYDRLPIPYIYNRPIGVPGIGIPGLPGVGIPGVGIPGTGLTGIQNAGVPVGPALLVGEVGPL